MKKVFSILIIFLTFIILYFLQVNFFNWFNIAGVKPNLFIVFLLFIGLFMGKIYGFTIGIVFGLLLDIFIGKVLGMNAIILGMAGLFGGILEKNFSKDNRATMMLMASGTTFICEVVSYILQIIIFDFSVEILPFLKILLIEIIYNLLIIIIIYPLMDKAGVKLEKIFTESNILTKYY